MTGLADSRHISDATSAVDSDGFREVFIRLCNKMSSAPKAKHSRGQEQLPVQRPAEVSNVENLEFSNLQHKPGIGGFLKIKFLNFKLPMHMGVP